MHSAWKLKEEEEEKKEGGPLDYNANAIHTNIMILVTDTMNSVYIFTL
jgi:hypothetical protein